MLPWPEIITTGRSGCIVLDLVEQLQAVEPRALQPDVEEHQARHAASIAASALSVVRGARAVALVAQDAGDEFADVGLVVDDEDVRRHETSALPAWRRSSAAESRRLLSPRAGNANHCARGRPGNPAGASWSSRPPPWSSMIFLTIARPRPVPFSRVVI
jgi:hypothetical protein